MKILIFIRVFLDLKFYVNIRAKLLQAIHVIFPRKLGIEKIHLSYQTAFGTFKRNPEYLHIHH